MTVIRRGLAVLLFVGLLMAGWNFAHGNPQVVPIDYLLGQTEPLPNAIDPFERPRVRLARDDHVEAVRAEVDRRQVALEVGAPQLGHRYPPIKPRRCSSTSRAAPDSNDEVAASTPSARVRQRPDA